MNPKTLSLALSFFAFLFVHAIGVSAQGKESIGSGVKAKEGLGRTWKGPSASLFAGILRRKQVPKAGGGRISRRSAPRAVSPSSIEPVTFKPAGDSGVPKALADAFGRDPAEKLALTEAFSQIKQGYETEVAKEGKSNDLAAAMTFFIAANITAYHQTELPSDEAGENLYRSLRDSMTNTPEFAKISNAEKQQMHDWLICMGGFVMAGYMEAKQTGDQESLTTFSELADQSMRLVLGIDGSKLNLGPNGLLPVS